jgi:hypothetical protein
VECRRPTAAIDGVVRWRLVDLCQWIWEQFRVGIAKQTLSRELRAMGYRKLSARPRHHAQADGIVHRPADPLHQAPDDDFEPPVVAFADLGGHRLSPDPGERVQHAAERLLVGRVVRRHPVERGALEHGVPEEPAAGRRGQGGRMHTVVTRRN